MVFLDEPTTGVDVGTRQFLWDRINAKGARGCALILTTHYMEESRQAHAQCTAHAVHLPSARC